MRTILPARRTGLTLLEVMVALVILGLVATGFLETFAGALHGSSETRIWAQALTYAADGQEAVKIGGADLAAANNVRLGGGFTRRIALHPWKDGLQLATVVVTLPGGRQFELERLVPAP